MVRHLPLHAYCLVGLRCDNLQYWREHAAHVDRLVVLRLNDGAGGGADDYYWRGPEDRLLLGGTKTCSGRRLNRKRLPPAVYSGRLWPRGDVPEEGLLAGDS